MRLKFIVIIFSTILLMQNCDNSSNNKRKIKLADPSQNSINYKSLDQSTIIKLEAENKQKIAILTFKNLTNNDNLEWLCQGISDMLIRDLSQSHFIKVVPPQRIYDILKKIKYNSPNIMDAKLIAVIGKMTNAEAVIKGSFSNVNDSLFINMQLYNVKTGKLLEEKYVKGVGLEQVFAMVDELTDKVRSDFRLTMKESSEHDYAISDISTKSLEAYKYYTEGINLAYKSYLGDAIKNIEKAIKIDSTFAMAHYRAAIIYNKLEKTNQAKTAITKSLKYADNTSPKEKMKIEWLHTAFKGDFKYTFDLLRKLVQAYPYDKELVHQLAYTYYRIKEINKAEKYIEYTLQLDPEYTPALILKSLIFREKGDFDSAIHCLETCLEINPDNADYYYNLAEIYQSKKKFQKAIKYHKKALMIKQDFHFSVVGLANIYKDLGINDQALELYQSALKILPSEELKAGIYAGISEIDQNLGKYNQAIKHINQAIQCQSSEEGQANYLALKANIYLKKGEIDSSLTLLRKASTLDSNSLRVNFILGKAFLNAGKIDSSKIAANRINNYITSSKLEIFRNRHYRLLGIIANAEGNYNKALDYFNKILKSNLESTSPYLDLGSVYENKNEPLKAIKVYKFYIREKPKDALIRYRLALAYKNAEKVTIAQSFMKKFIEMWQNADPDIPELKKAKEYLTLWN